MRDRYVSGTQCTVNRNRDMFMIYEARQFFGCQCVIVKRTKSGLVQVALASNAKAVYSFPQSNVDLADDAALADSQKVAPPRLLVGWTLR